MTEREADDVGYQVRSGHEHRKCSSRAAGKRDGLRINAVSLIGRHSSSFAPSSPHFLATSLVVS
jgi:hypothetical protein